MKIEFRKSFARDLKRRKNDLPFLDSVKEIIEEVGKAESVTDVKD